MYKEQNGARPMRAEAGSGIAETRRETEEKRQGRKTKVTENSRNGKKKQLNITS
jgi:hypothetical protein